MDYKLRWMTLALAVQRLLDADGHELRCSCACSCGRVEQAKIERANVSRIMRGA